MKSRMLWILWFAGLVALTIMVGSVLIWFDVLEDYFFLLISIVLASFSVAIFRPVFTNLSVLKRILIGLIVFVFGSFAVFGTIFVMTLITAPQKQPSSVTSEITSMTSDDETAVKEKSERVYPITDGKTYRIVAGKQYLCEHTPWAPNKTEQILEVYSSDVWKEVYRTPIESNCFSSLTIGDTVRISPNGKYVEFSLWGYE